MLPLRELGTTGLEIPPLVFGATSLGNLFRQVPEEEKSAIVSRWMTCGVAPVVIDSAGKYGAGLSLEVIGRELQRLHVSPERLILSNKLAWRRVPLTGNDPTFEPGAWFGLEHDAVQDISYEGILRCFREGNALLRGYNANLVSVHDPDEYLAAARDTEDRSRRKADIVDAYRALVELKQTGEVAAVGMGAKDWRVIAELSVECDLDWVMLANSLTVMHHPRELVEFVDSLAARGVGVINSALFHGGFLLGGDYFDYRLTDPAHPTDAQRLEWRDRFHDVCERFEAQPFDVGVAFGRAHPGVTAVALSSSRADRVLSHLEAIRSTLPRDLWSALQAEGLIRPDLSFL